MPVLMLIDDDPGITLLVCRLGQQRGFRIHPHPDAETAWDQLSRERPELAIIDVNLPGESGLELCARIRAEPSLADLPLVHFGQVEHTQSIVAGFAAGMDFFLDKDLLCQPERWLQRLDEIYGDLASRGRTLSLTWQKQVKNLLLPREMIPRLRQALRYPPLGSVGADLLEAFARTAWPPSATAPQDWLPLFSPSNNGTVPITALLAFTESLTRLLGHDAVSPLVEVVTAVLARLESEQQS